MAKRPTTRSKDTDAAAAGATETETRTRRDRAAGDTAAEVPAEASAPQAAGRRSRATTTSGGAPTSATSERGGNHGQHFDDWLEAEKELKK